MKAFINTTHPDPQLSLFDAPPPPQDPDAIRLMEYMDRAFTWRTRDQICRDLGVEDRWIRSARHAANFHVVAGQKGFRHIRHCTEDERNAAPEHFESQGKDMLAIASGLRRAAAFWNFSDANRRRLREPAHA